MVLKIVLLSSLFQIQKKGKSLRKKSQMRGKVNKSKRKFKKLKEIILVGKRVKKKIKRMTLIQFKWKTHPYSLT